MYDPLFSEPLCTTLINWGALQCP